MMNMNLHFMNLQAYFIDHWPLNFQTKGQGWTRYVIWDANSVWSEYSWSGPNHSGKLSYVTILTRRLGFLATHQCILNDGIIFWHLTHFSNRAETPTYVNILLKTANISFVHYKRATMVFIIKETPFQPSLVLFLFKTIIKFPHLGIFPITCMRGTMTLTITELV